MKKINECPATTHGWHEPKVSASHKTATASCKACGKFLYGHGHIETRLFNYQYLEDTVRHLRETISGAWEESIKMAHDAIQRASVIYLPYNPETNFDFVLENRIKKLEDDIATMRYRWREHLIVTQGLTRAKADGLIDALLKEGE